MGFGIENAEFGERLLGLVDQAVALVLGLDELATLLVVGGMGLGVAAYLQSEDDKNHGFHFVVDGSGLQ